MEALDPIQRFIVNHDGLAITRPTDVELHAVAARNTCGCRERAQRVRGRLAPVTLVREAKRSVMDHE